MIWFRRFLALGMAIAFFLTFILALFVWRVNSTVGNPGFYVEQLRQARAYNFIYDELLPAAMKDSSKESGSKEGMDLSFISPYVPGLVRQILPPETLQVEVEKSINAVLPYIFGDTEHFVVNIPLKPRVEAAVKAVKALLRKDEIKGKLYDQLVAMFVSRAIEGFGQAPLSKGELETLARSVLPPDWLLSQIDRALDEVTPYFTGDREHFTVRINLPPNVAGFKSDPLIGKLVDAGLTFSDKDLYIFTSDLGRIEQIRKIIGGGLSFSEREMRELIGGSGGTNGGEGLRNFDNTRANLRTARTLITVSWLLPLFLLVIIGLLGGRTWGSKLIWAVVVLLLGSLLALIVFGPVLTSVVHSGLAGMTQTPSTDLVQGIISAKVASIVQNAANTFLGGVTNTALVYLGISVVLCVLGAVLHVRSVRYS